MSGRDAEVARWLAMVDDDLRSAHAVIGLTPPATGPAAFHCQQAVEKLMKTVLVQHGMIPERTYDLNRLLLPTLAREPGLEPLLRPLLPLTDWAVSPRYPDMTYDLPIEADEVRAVLPLIEQLLDAVEGIVMPRDRVTGDERA